MRHSPTWDGSTVTVHGDSYAVPAPAPVLLRAPFIYVTAGTVSHTRVRATVRAALLDVGVPLLSRKVDLTWASNDWLDRWGAALQKVS